jgi:hypothetical protein
MKQWGQQVFLRLTFGGYSDQESSTNLSHKTTQKPTSQYCLHHASLKSYLPKDWSNNMHYIMVLKSFYKIKIYSIVFQWRPPRSSGKVQFTSSKTALQKKKNCLIMRTQLDPLRIFYQRRTWWAQMHSIDEECRPP